MAKSRYRRRGATRGRLRVKMLGKGCKAIGERVLASKQRRTYVKVAGKRPQDLGAAGLK